MVLLLQSREGDHETIPVGREGIGSRTTGRDRPCGNCNPDLMALLSEAHVSGVRVYALFADGQTSFSESSMAAYPYRFNANMRDGRYLLRRCRREQRILRAHQGL